jgi:hypothetical protein
MKKVIRLNESDLMKLVKMVIKEQSSGNSVYKVGQTLKAKRSIDGKEYNLKVAKVKGNYVGVYIQGTGNIDGKIMYELSAEKPGVLSGNMEMGTFTIVK